MNFQELNCKASELIMDKIPLIVCAQENNSSDMIVDVRSLVSYQFNYNEAGEIIIPFPMKKNHREFAVQLTEYLNKVEFEKVQLYIDLEDEHILEVIEVIALMYPQSNLYKTNSVTAKLKEIYFIVKDKQTISSKLVHMNQVVQNVFYARNLINRPANEFRPSDFVAEASKLEALGINCKVLQGNAIAEMGCLSAVGQASSDKAKLIILERIVRPGEPIVGLIGKGITFDTGGLSIKTPSSHMETMKADMAGGATVMAIIKAAAEIQFEHNLVVIVPCAENMISGDAIRPGDVVKSLSGQTVEILNTDAEGRLVLCDAITYMENKYKPAVLIDFATLTGAMSVALGKVYMGLFSNSDALARILKVSGESTNERVWRMPLGREYDALLESKVADMKNIASPGSGAGSITAAQFLARFVKTKAWAHIDFANTAYLEEAGPRSRFGATGDGVRLVLHALPDLVELAYQVNG